MSLENCFRCKLSCDVISTLRQLESSFEIAFQPHRNLWLIRTFSFISFKLFLLHDIYLFEWIYIRFSFHSRSHSLGLNDLFINKAQKIKFSIKEFFGKYDQIRSFLRICSHLLKKSLMENLTFCVVG